MGRILYDFKCDRCEYEAEEYIDTSKESPDVIKDCPHCMGTTYRRAFKTCHARSPKISASYLDGSKRFDKLKETRKLKREASRAKRAMKFDEAKEATKELAIKSKEK